MSNEAPNASFDWYSAALPVDMTPTPEPLGWSCECAAISAYPFAVPEHPEAHRAVAVKVVDRAKHHRRTGRDHRPLT